MNHELTDITVILDRSGSMSSVKNDTEGGFDQFVIDQKKVPGKAVLTLVQFDDRYDLVYESKDLSEVRPLQLEPRGSTALLDAIGKTIQNTGERLRRMKEKDRPGKVIFVILTDGEENASVEYNRTKINEMITHQTEKYSWNFVFLGSNIDAIKEARFLGINVNSALNYSGVKTKSAFSATSDAIRSYRCQTTSDISYSDKNREDSI